MQNRMDAMQARLNGLNQRLQSATRQSSRGRQRTHTERATVQQNDLVDQINNLTREIDENSISLDDAKRNYNVTKKDFDEFEAEFKYRTVDELLAYSKTLVRPAAEYYTSKFNEVDGDLYNLKQASRVAQLFDPFYIKDKSVAALELLADDLTYFGYDSLFTDAFIDRLKQEIPSLIVEAQKEFDWEAVGNSKQYLTRSMKRAKRRTLDNDDENNEEDWKKDPGEMASRIWEWWRTRVYEVENPKLQFFAQAIRVVVLTQLSSCAVERVFSQLKLIRDACGDNMMEDMLEIRMFELCNGDLTYILN